MSKKTRVEIFAESERRYPDFGSFQHHALSLGFEAGAAWVDPEQGYPSLSAIDDRALELFPEEEGVEGSVASNRRIGFRKGVQWAISEYEKPVTPTELDPKPFVSPKGVRYAWGGIYFGHPSDLKFSPRKEFVQDKEAYEKQEEEMIP